MLRLKCRVFIGIYCVFPHDFYFWHQPQTNSITNRWIPLPDLPNHSHLPFTQPALLRFCVFSSAVFLWKRTAYFALHTLPYGIARKISAEQQVFARFQLNFSSWLHLLHLQNLLPFIANIIHPINNVIGSWKSTETNRHFTNKQSNSFNFKHYLNYFIKLHCFLMAIILI